MTLSGLVSASSTNETCGGSRPMQNVSCFHNMLSASPGPCAQLSGQVIIPFDFLGNALGLDPRITSWLPNLPGGGLFGPPGNGGNLGKK